MSEPSIEIYPDEIKVEEDCAFGPLCCDLLTSLDPGLWAFVRSVMVGS